MADPMTTETAEMFMRQRDDIDRAFMAWRKEHGDEVERLRQALLGIRGVVLGPLDERKKSSLINEIVGEALYGDSEGVLKLAYKHGWAVR